MNQLSFLSEEPRVSPSQLQDSERGWTTRVATCRSSFLQLLANTLPGGQFGKTFLECFPTEQTLSATSSPGYLNSGMASAGESLMLNTSAWPSDAAVCSLSDILETGSVPQRFFLSAKACQGILRRAEKRGKELPEALSQALSIVATREDSNQCSRQQQDI